MGFQAVQDKNAIVFAWDTAGATRIIYLDDRKHVPANIRLYQGDSVARWEGDVLVVDTTSQAAGWWDASGAVHSDQLHVVERFTFKDANNIYYEALVEDPVALTRPMTVTDTFRRNSTSRLDSQNVPQDTSRPRTACVEGEQDLAKYPKAAAVLQKKEFPALMHLRARSPAAVAVVEVPAAPAAVLPRVAQVVVVQAAVDRPRLRNNKPQINGTSRSSIAMSHRRPPIRNIARNIS
jgi:hypothetical protein